MIDVGDTVVISGDTGFDGMKGRKGIVTSIITEADSTHDDEVLPIYVVDLGDHTSIELWFDEMTKES